MWVLKQNIFRHQFGISQTQTTNKSSRQTSTRSWFANTLFSREKGTSTYLNPSFPWSFNVMFKIISKNSKKRLFIKSFFENKILKKFLLFNCEIYLLTPKNRIRNDFLRWMMLMCIHWRFVGKMILSESFVIPQSFLVEWMVEGNVKNRSFFHLWR